MSNTTGRLHSQEDLARFRDVQPFAWFGDRTAFRGFIGFCDVLGENKLLDKLLDDLLEYRQLILSMAKARAPLASISQAVDALCAKHGYEPRHKAYPFETLAHRVEKLKDDGKKSHFSLAQAA